MDKRNLPKASMLKKIRVVASLTIFLLLTFFFIDFAGLLSLKFHGIAHFQFIPALLALNIGIVVFILIITALFGRVYCSSLCPMGTLQDIIHHTLNKKRKFKYIKSKPILRWGIVGAVVIAFLLGFPLLLGLLDPYSAFGRVTTHLLKPLYLLGNNLLSHLFNYFGNYTIYCIEIGKLAFSSFIVALSTLLIIGFFAWKYGRLYCNTICPVGTILGAVSKYSLFKINIDDSKCNGCRLCETNCKASCINSQNHTIDHSRCVDCFNCLSVCKQKALSFSLKKKTVKEEVREQQVDEGKRQFLLTSLATAIAIPTVMAKKEVNALAGKDASNSSTVISPPGSLSVEHLNKHCTSCHLCVSKCPSQVLKPAFLEYGVGGMMQPRLSFKDGFCKYDCTVCSAVCPNSAIRRLTTEEKRHIQIGKAILKSGSCVAYAQGANCGACAEHCPTKAIKMISYEEGFSVPTVNKDTCIGCGACEYACPVHAIYVEGYSTHQQIKHYLSPSN